MLFIMCVSLYTSRVVLKTLGIMDYGIYNVVGGVVAVFAFINSSMATATQRFITYALGKGDKRYLNNIFSTAIEIHISLSFLIFLLSETIGLWFLYYKMQIPADRLDAAFWVLQFSIATSIIMVLSVPYNATIIANEKMSAFAYISVLEVVLKLLIVYALSISPFDNLVIYAFLLLVVQLIIRICYGMYCHKKFKETVYHKVWNKSLFKEMLGFTGWNICGNLAGMLSSQGVDLILNTFFGPTINAARGLAVQVQVAISQLSSNFQMAVNPQITITYAKNELSEMHRLIISCSRFTFYLLYIMSLPIFFLAEDLLKLWLETVPEYTAVFLQLSLIVTIIDSVANPLMIAAQATGKIRKFLTIIAVMALFIAPISYIALKLGAKPYSVYLVHIVICSLIFIVRLYLIKPLIDLDIRKYSITLFKSTIPVILTSIIIVACLGYIIPYNTPFLLICKVFLFIICTSILIYIIGLEKNEKAFIKGKIFIHINK